MASSWNRALADVPTQELVNCYDRAAADYTDIEKPFGTPQLLKAWQLIIDDRRQQRAHSIKPQSDAPCYYCFDSGYQTIIEKPGQQRMLHGEKYTSAAAYTSVRPCACSAAPSGQRSDFPLREPVYSRDPGGRWWCRNE